jgi:hypothetical protein
MGESNLLIKNNYYFFSSSCTNRSRWITGGPTRLYEARRV